MPRRKTIFINNGIYHVLNKDVNSAPIFLNNNDHQRFLDIVNLCRYNPQIKFSLYNRLHKQEKNEFLDNLKKKHEPIIDILAFSLMPNHFHLLLKQLQDKGIQIFLGNLQNSYAKYFNIKNKRTGPLFQSAFKSIDIETDEQLIHVSRYIHLNPVSSYIIDIENLENYKWSSFGNYLNDKKYEFVASATILGYFKTQSKYRKFVFDQADYQRELEEIKHLAIE